MDLGTYCREIESYLCRKNKGHLIRIVGPAFACVCGWAESGVPLRIVCRGIDRKLERYLSSGRMARPLRIEHCEADVLDVFAEWGRAVGVTVPREQPAGVVRSGSSRSEFDKPIPRRGSLPAHIERVLARVTSRLALRGAAPGMQEALEEVLAGLDALWHDSKIARGKARAVLVERLSAIDRALVVAVRAAAGQALEEINIAARAELAPFKARMENDSYARALSACSDRLLRERFHLPTIRFD